MQEKGRVPEILRDPGRFRVVMSSGDCGERIRVPPVGLKPSVPKQESTFSLHQPEKIIPKYAYSPVIAPPQHSPQNSPLPSPAHPHPPHSSSPSAVPLSTR
jgi:hypothetical protein